jgi:hypothetical protein
VSDALGAASTKAVVVLTRDRERGSASLAFSSSEISRPQPSPPMSTLIRHLDGLTKPLDWPAVFSASLPSEERSWLEEHGIVLLVPLATSAGALEGVLLLGEKRSEEPYATRDRELLGAIGRQMAIVLENSGLKERVAREERLARELLSRYESDRRFVRECPSCARCHDGDATVCDRCGARLVVSLPVERQLGGRYRLDRLLGARRHGRDTPPRRASGPRRRGEGAHGPFSRQGRRRSLRARGAHLGQLSHPNIITVFDWRPRGGRRVPRDGARSWRHAPYRARDARFTFSARKARTIFEPLLAGPRGRARRRCGAP